MVEEETKDQSPEQEESGKKKDQYPLPSLLEVSLILWKMVIVVVGGLTALLSWWKGASLLAVAYRSGAAIICLGALAYIFISLLSRSLLEAVTRRKIGDTQ